MEKIKNNWQIILLLFVIGCCIFFLNIATLISPDDYSYAMIFGGDDLKITSFSEIRNASKFLYESWTGRIIPHVLVGIFTTTNLWIFYILNTIMFIVLLLIITRFITQKNTYLSLIMAFGFLVYGKMFGEKFAWISGSLNYLWTAVILMIYLYTFYGYIVENRKLNKWQKIILTLSSYIVGFLHEVTAFVGGSFLGIMFLTNIKKIWKSENKKDRLFFILTIFLFALGAFTTIFSPGNFLRNQSDPTQKGTVFSCLGNYKDIKWQLIITFITMVAIGFLNQKELLKKEIIYFVLPCVIATLPFAYLGYFTPRSFVCYECLIIIIMTTNIQYLVNNFKKYKKSIIAISILFTIIVFARMMPSIYSDIRYILPYKLKLTKQLEQNRENGVKDVVVSRFLFRDKFHMEDMINPDNFFLETYKNNISNVYMALYYKFDCIQAISDIDYIVEIETDIDHDVDYGIINKDTLELISIVTARDKLTFTIPKDKYGLYVVDCRDKDLRSHVKSVRVRAVGEEMKNPNIEDLINQEKI